MSDVWDGAEHIVRAGDGQRAKTTSRFLSGAGDAADGLTITHHSGLPLTMRNGVPVEPDHLDSGTVELSLKRLLLDLPLATAALF